MTSETRIGIGLVVVALLFAAGCESDTKFLDKNQNQAVETALARGKFELNCPEAKSTILSREAVEPVVTGLYLGGAYPVARAEYTIGVEGCGKRTTFVVVCPDTGEGCLAAGPGKFLVD
jgi:hypothetical protein